MPDKIVSLVRHDGTLMDATPEQAQRLSLLGYREVTPEENQARLAAEGRQDYYTSADQKIAAAGEGLTSGLTFGGSDYLFGDDETKARAVYNPGTRMASEMAGAMLPMLLGGEPAAVRAVQGVEGAEGAGVVSKLADISPPSLLSRGVEAVLPGRGTTAAIGRGILEGSIYGGAGAADHAYLDGEPITAEAVLHGLGWGAVVGGGLAAFGGGVRDIGDSELAAREGRVANRQYAETAEQERVDALNADNKARYKQQVEAANGRVREPVPQGALDTTAGAEFTALRSEVTNLDVQMKRAGELADAEATQIFADAQKVHPLVRDDISSEMKTLYEKAKEAVTRGKADAAKEAIEAYSKRADDLAQMLQPADPAGQIKYPNAGKALEELMGMRATQKALSSVPRDVVGFARMSASKTEQMLAGLEQAAKQPFTSGIKDAAAEFVKALGVDPTVAGATDGGLRAAQRAAKDLYAAEGKPGRPFVAPKAPRVVEPRQYREPGEAEAEGSPSLARRAAGYAVGGKMWLAARASGFGKVGAYTAYRATRDAITYGGHELVGLRASVLAHLKNAAADYFPAAGRGLERSSGRLAGLSVSIFGQPDTSTTDPRQLALNRTREIAQFSPVAANSIFKAVEPLSVSQPMLTPSIHKSAMEAFVALQAMSPKDPGAVSALNSLWKPSDVATAKLAKQLAVFQDPLGEAAKMLQGGAFDPVKVAALKEIAPSTYQYMRTALLQRISEPGVLEKASYKDQIGLSVVLGIPIHTSMTPRFIATSQQIFLDRSQPLKANPRMGQSGGLPNPKDNNFATGAQKSTER